MKCGRVPGALLALFLWQGVLAGQEQERECTLVRVGGYTVSKRQDSVHYAHRASGGIDYRCTDGTRILADSAAVWERSGDASLIRRVHFEDADTELDADSALYFANVRELLAWSGVTLTDLRNGAVLMGDTLSYQRESRFRTMDRIRVYGGHPRAVVYPAPRPAAPVPGPDPVEVAPAEDGFGGEEAVPPMDSQVDEPAGDPPVDSLAEQPPAVSAAEDPAGAPPESDEDMGAAEDPVPADSVTPRPYEVDAPRLYIDGRRFFRAGGGVVVTRDSLRAFGDSLDYDQEVGVMLIFGDAHVVDRGFELRGVSVSVTPAAGLNEEILAREEATLMGDQVLMQAPAIRLFLEDGQVSRIVALPSVVPMPGLGGEEPDDTTGLTPGDAARARALAEAARREAERDTAVVPERLPRPSVVAGDFNLTGDSIEVLSPNQLLDVVTAVGAARADAMNPDSPPAEGLPEVAANDWIEGETIVARFASEEPAEDSVAATRDTTPARVRLESVTATRNARSLYRVVVSDTVQTEADSARTEPDVARAEAGAAQVQADTGQVASDPGQAESDTAQAQAEAPPAASGGAAPVTAAPVAEAGAPPAESGDDPGGIDVPSAANDSLRGEEDRPPALHYVRGNQITIHMEGRKVVRMEVQGETVGFHLEPLPPDSLSAAGDSADVASDALDAAADTTDAAADTTDAAADTTTAAADTARTPPDTTRVPAPARREAPRHPGSRSFRHGFHPPLPHRPAEARE